MKLDNQPHVLRTLAKFIVWKKREQPLSRFDDSWNMKKQSCVLNLWCETENSTISLQLCIVSEIAFKNIFTFDRYRPKTFLQKPISILDFWYNHETKEQLYKATLFKRSEEGCEFEIRIHLGHLACVKNFEALYLQSDFRHVAYVWQISW